MSAFTHGFQHGFFHGMFNRMFCGWNMFACWNQAPMFFTPNYMQGGFFQYQTPMMAMPSVWNVNVPNFGAVTPSWGMVQSSNNYSIPDFSTTFDWSNVDTFKKSTAIVHSNKTVSKGHKVTSPIAKSYADMTDSELRSVYGNYTKNITQLYSGTAQDLNKHLAKRGVLAGKGQAFIDAQKEYGISASVLAAICINESGGTSNLALNSNNVGGVRGKNGWKKYSSVEECIKDIARFLKQNYVNENLVCLYQVNAKYCPIQDSEDKKGTNSGWAANVNKIAESLERA